ncbi:protein NATD1 [Rhagoletis pomonella]|uniref:protein NATD1 n=1 Tax=Rhagoletis pomonella TaxID=28610 RepID=UPI00177FB7ED|nr:protein NATD1 [Rhagoletis pomonella]
MLSRFYGLAITKIHPTMRMFCVNGSTKLHVQHSLDENQFFVDVGPLRAHLDYEKEGRRMRIVHTEVPSAIEGRGLGKFLAKEALEYAAKNDLNLKVDCEFVQHYINKYEPKYIKLMSE